LLCRPALLRVILLRAALLRVALLGRHRTWLVGAELVRRAGLLVWALLMRAWLRRAGLIWAWGWAELVAAGLLRARLVGSRLVRAGGCGAELETAGLVWAWLLRRGLVRAGLVWAGRRWAWLLRRGLVRAKLVWARRHGSGL
jgi:hypothetical protein